MRRTEWACPAFRIGVAPDEVFADFDFFEDVDAIFAAVSVAALCHVCEPLFR